jgi:hypothetical protein
VNGLTTQHHLYSFRDFIVAQLKRVKKHARFKKGQRWVHRVQFRQAIYYCYPLDSDDDPLIFPQGKGYCGVTEPEIVFVLDLETETLMTKEEWDAPI